MLILASGSPRRREILEMLGYRFAVCPADADETVPPGMPPHEAVQLLAQRKAEAVAQTHPNDVVLGSDTLVYCNGQLLGKPTDTADAERMLRLLSGRTHRVYTGVAVLSGGKERVWCVESEVRFLPLSETDIAAYIATGEPVDKAGAYAIQGRGSALVDSISGDFFAIMGLPCSSVVQALRAFGIAPEG